MKESWSGRERKNQHTVFYFQGPFDQLVGRRAVVWHNSRPSPEGCDITITSGNLLTKLFSLIWLVFRLCYFWRPQMPFIFRSAHSTFRRGRNAGGKDSDNGQFLSTAEAMGNVNLNNGRAHQQEEDDVDSGRRSASLPIFQC